jgi:hypothetical protein
MDTEENNDVPIDDEMFSEGYIEWNPKNPKD